MTRYNHRIRQMSARASGLRLLFPHSLFLALVKLVALLFSIFLPSLLLASNLGDTARQLADRISSVTGPSSIAFELTNRSSLDEKSVREVRSALESELHAHGVRAVAADQSVGTVSIVLSESLRDYVWTAEVTIGFDQPRIVLVSQPHPLSAAPLGSALPITLKKTFLFSQEQPILDAALVDMSGSARLLILDPSRVAIYRQQSGHWELESALPIQHSRPFPRDIRGRLFLRHDHLFDIYLPGTFCQSSRAAPLTLACSASDDPWPLTADESTTNGVAPVHAFYASARNFFTGAISPAIGKVSNIPSFYTAAVLPRANYSLWMLAAVDGSIHMIDGITDQAIRARWGSDLAAVRSNCGSGTQLLVTGDEDPAHDKDRDTLRAFEIPDRDPVAASPPLDFNGPITALWPDASQTSAITIVRNEDKREDKSVVKSEDSREFTGLYEAYRISIDCAN